MRVDKINVMELKENNNILWFKDICIVDDKAWIVAGNYNGLYELSLSDGELEYLGIFSGENVFAKQLYERIFFCSNVLVAVPSYADSIGIYDLEKGMFDYVELPKPHVPYRSDYKFMSACMYDGKIFMFPGYYPYIIEFDVETRKVKVHAEWYNIYINYGKQKSDLEFHMDLVVVGHNAYLVSAQYNIIFQFNMKNGDFSFFEIGWGALMTLAYDGNFFWSINTESVLFKWHLTDFNSVEEIQIETKNELFIYSNILYPFLVLVPSQGCEIIYFNVENNKIYKEELVQDSNRYEGYEYHRFHFAKKISEQEMILQDRKDRSIQIISNQGLKKWKDSLADTSVITQEKFEKNEYYQYMIERHNKQYMHKNPRICFIEEKYFGVDALIYHMNRLNELDEDGELNNNIGTKIYQEIDGFA